MYVRFIMEIYRVSPDILSTISIGVTKVGATIQYVLPKPLIFIAVAWRTVGSIVLFTEKVWCRRSLYSYEVI